MSGDYRVLSRPKFLSVCILLEVFAPVLLVLLLLRPFLLLSVFLPFPNCCCIPATVKVGAVTQHTR